MSRRCASQLGIRTIFNLLGPLSNPARVTPQLVGVFAREWLDALGRGAWRARRGEGLGRARPDGLDEMTTTGVTHVAALEDGSVRQL